MPLESTLAKVYQNKRLQLPLESTLMKNRGEGAPTTHWSPSHPTWVPFIEDLRVRQPFLSPYLLVSVAILISIALTGCGSTMTSTTSTGGNRNPGPDPAPSSIDVVTYHYDNLRTGQNLQETILTPANVTASRFGKFGELMVDGKVDAQPLYLSNVAIPGVGTRNVLYVVTEHGSVFAFDADNTSASAAPFWKITTQLPGEMPSDDRGCGQVTPEIGITSTPVIDRTRGAIYVVAASKDASAKYFHRIHALDLTTAQDP